MNDDDSSLPAYMTAKSAKINEREEIEEMKKDIDEIKNIIGTHCRQIMSKNPHSEFLKYHGFSNWIRQIQFLLQM